MTLSPSDRHRQFERVASPAGGLSMVAMDQRESLRTMFRESLGDPVPDSMLVDFKRAVAETLSPHATAVLLDKLYGMEGITALHPGCGLVLAVDKLEQPAGEPVMATDLDPDLNAPAAQATGAAALKLLLLWRPDDDPTPRGMLVRRFLDLSHDVGMLAILEGVVRPPASGAGWDREAAILEAARDLGSFAPDLYKAEVPLQGRAEPSKIEQQCRTITESMPCPWVVLSSGVTSDAFPVAVEAACRGGASGFLAGRGIWMDLVGSGDYRARLHDVAVPRLERLREIVERHARPWWEGLNGTVS